MSSFRFKQFTVNQDRAAMKVGTDGVLLGAWTPCQEPEGCRILDVGTGTGLIALMMAQRCKSAIIDAIDIDIDALADATENCRNSIFRERINVVGKSTAIQDFDPGYKYDIIVCNPPFFNRSLPCPDKSRAIARHTKTLTYNDLAEHSYRLLNENGTLSIIIPATERDLFLSAAGCNNIVLRQETSVYTTPTSEVRRVLLNFAKSLMVKDVMKTNLTIELSRHVYTEEYIALTRDFYLKM